jgi:hypothetical protein
MSLSWYAVAEWQGFVGAVALIGAVVVILVVTIKRARG